MGWLYGFKLHTIINLKAELVSIKLTSGNVEDRESLKHGMADNLFSKLFGDRDNVSQALIDRLKEFDINFTIKLRRNLKEQHLAPFMRAY